MIKHIPNFITLLNLFSGCIALVYALDGSLITSSVFIGIAAVFDFLDGMAARLFKVTSNIGKDLDSLADVVSFGVVPGAILFMLLSDSMASFVTSETAIMIIPFTGFIIPLFSALRLAKFNSDKRQQDAFYGLPTPANALFIAAIPFILQQEYTLLGPGLMILKRGLLNPVSLMALVIILSWLLIADFRLLSLKFKSFAWHDNQARFVFLIISLILILFLYFSAAPFILLMYIIISATMKV
jgi:CDP-diacylglycerol--serine O-phosphatidyltransferase